MTHDLRKFITEWEGSGPTVSIRVKEGIDPHHEVSAFVKSFDRAGKWPLIIFEKINGFKDTIVCNVGVTREQLGVALGCEAKALEDVYDRAEERVLHGDTSLQGLITVPDGPVKEVKWLDDKVDLGKYPFLVHHTGEQPYITRAIGIAKDPVSGCYQAGHYRLMVRDKKRMITHLTPGEHMWHIYENCCNQGIPLEMAFILGNHPAWHMAAQSQVSHPPGELEIIPALTGEKLEMVKCETIDVKIPACAEMVIEGKIMPGELEMEGPWTDFTKYSQMGKKHPFHVTAITHRGGSLLLEDTGAWLSRDMPFQRIPQRVSVRRKIKELMPAVVDFNFAFFPKRMFGLVSIRKKHPAEARQAILTALAVEPYLKYVIAVDPDIDLENINDITWALATRVEAEKDIMFIPRVLGTDLDISAVTEGLVSKVGIDATAKPFLEDYPEKGQIPESQQLLTLVASYLK